MVHPVKSLSHLLAPAARMGVMLKSTVVFNVNQTLNVRFTVAIGPDLL